MGESKDFLCRLWELDDVFNLLVLVRRCKMLFVELRSGTKEILLDTKRRFLGANEDNDESRMRLAANDINTCS